MAKAKKDVKGQGSIVQFEEDKPKSKCRKWQLRNPRVRTPERLSMPPRQGCSMAPIRRRPRRCVTSSMKSSRARSRGRDCGGNLGPRLARSRNQLHGKGYGPSPGHVVQTGHHPHDNPISDRFPWHARLMGRVPPLSSARVPRSRRSSARGSRRLPRPPHARATWSRRGGGSARSAGSSA